MPPAPKRNAAVILYDVKCHPEFQRAAKRCLLNICGMKWFTGSKDCAKLILVNTKESDNQLHAKFNQAPHISEVTDVIQYNPGLIHAHLEGVETAEANWVIALAVALEELKDNYENQPGVMTLQILFITDFFTKTNDFKEKRVNFIITRLNTLNVFLYILGPKVKIPEQMATVADVRRWSRNVEFINGVNDLQLNTVKNIVEKTNNSIVCDLDLGVHLFLNYRNYWGLQPWQVPLTAGTAVTFPAATTRFLRSLQPPKIKAQDQEKAPWKWHLIEDIMVEVPWEDVIGGVAKHGKFIPLPLDVEKNFKCYGERRFKLVGFTDRRNISEVLAFGEGSSYIKSDCKNFNLLLSTLAKKKMCAIATKVYMRNCTPKLVALLPELEEGTFIMVDLPYRDNISFDINEASVQEAPKLEESSVEEVYTYLSKLDITNVENRDEDGSVKVPLAATLMNHIRMNSMYQFLLNKYMNEQINTEDEILMPVNEIAADSYFHLCPPRNNGNDSANT